REEAIANASTLTNCKLDAIIIAGKGADAYQIIKGNRDNYSGDLEVAKKYLKR
ncbi:TPA: UDP-N-acetylmuramoyl-L-alanyl-D-glutamate--L-lysine ligase, partial [Streptococcus agalactiae]